MPLENFEWEDELQEVPGVGMSVVGYAQDDDGNWYRIVVALSELEESAQRWVQKGGTAISEQRKH